MSEIPEGERHVLEYPDGSKVIFSRFKPTITSGISGPVTPKEDEEWERKMADKEAQQSDPVNHPEHYTQGGIECIEAIQAALTPEEFRGYCKGNAIKYIWRERHKGGAESVRKAEWYLNRL